jgi:hypothetical protein
MSVDIEQIEAMRTQTAAQIESLLAPSGPTITVGGVEMAWGPLVASLRDTLDWCDHNLAE